MEKLGYIILLVALIAWLAIIIIEVLPIHPHGTIGFIVLLGLGLLFAKALKDRIITTRRDRYSKEVKR